MPTPTQEKIYTYPYSDTSIPTTLSFMRFQSEADYCAPQLPLSYNSRQQFPALPSIHTNSFASVRYVFFCFSCLLGGIKLTKHIILTIHPEISTLSF